MINFIKLAVQNKLNAKVFGGHPFPPKTGECRISDNGQPAISTQGYVFIAIHNAYCRTLNGQEGYYLHEEFFFSLTISLEASDVPRLRFGDVVISGSEDGAEILSEHCLDWIHGNLSLYNEANTLIQQAGLSQKGGFLSKAPHLLSRGPAIPKTSSWFGATKDDKGTVCGCSYEIRFGGLEMVRYIGSLQT